VRLVGKHIGDIKPVEATADRAAGWAYFPKGRAGLRGDVFASVNLVKASLEAE